MTWSPPGDRWVCEVAGTVTPPASVAVSNFSFTDKPTTLAQSKFPSIVSGLLIRLDEVRVAALVARARTRLREV